MYNMNLKNLYGTFLKNGNSPEAFIANVIYERYGAKRKKMLQGLYNIINGGPKPVSFTHLTLPTNREV